MANEYYNDIEQGEAVKKWLQENYGAIIMGIALGFAALIGWQRFSDGQVAAKHGAADAYTALTEVTDTSSETFDPQQQYNAFIDANDVGEYPALAALHLADIAVEQEKMDQAVALYKEAVDRAEIGPVKSIAALRLARAYVETEKFDQALQLASEYGTDAFVGIGEEIRGDILVLQGDKDGALAAYEKALSSQEVGVGNRQLLQMKIDNLGGNSELSES